MKEGFRSIEEILLEVAKDEGMSKKEIEDVWLHQQSFIKKQMEKEGVYSILLPFVGTLSLNVKQFTKELKYRPRELYKSFINKVSKLKIHSNYTKYENAHKKITGVNRLTRNIIKNYYTGIEKSKNLIIHSKCWDIISKYSNGVFKKRDKIIRKNERI